MACRKARSFTSSSVLGEVLRNRLSPVLQAPNTDVNVRKYKGCVKVMPTIAQLLRKPREVSRESSKSPALENC
ncbi:MAG: hypothetical protein WCY17_13850, partial [Castellaniella sp.]